MSIYHRRHPVIYIMAIMFLSFGAFRELGVSLASYIYASFLVLAIILYLAKLFFADRLYVKHSTSLVPKHLVQSSSSIRNRFCSVVLTPGQKIVVLDNDYGYNNAKRMFVLNQKDIKINEMWNKICKMYDENTNLDSLATFCNLEVYVNIVTYATKPIKDMATESVAQNASGLTESKSKVVDNKGKDSSVKVTTNKVSKIDINNASSEEIANLPGVNIVGAKKVVEYRNKNGLFKSEDEFIKIAGVKPHFVDKIKSMILIGKSQTTTDKDNDDGSGRIVDF